MPYIVPLKLLFDTQRSAAVAPARKRRFESGGSLTCCFVRIATNEYTPFAGESYLVACVLLSSSDEFAHARVFERPPSYVLLTAAFAAPQPFFPTSLLYPLQHMSSERERGVRPEGAGKDPPAAGGKRECVTATVRGRDCIGRDSRRTLSLSIGKDNFMSGGNINKPMTCSSLPRLESKGSSGGTGAQAPADVGEGGSAVVLAASLPPSQQDAATAVVPAAAAAACTAGAAGASKSTDRDADFPDPAAVAALFHTEGASTSPPPGPFPLGSLGVLGNRMIARGSTRVKNAKGGQQQQQQQQQQRQRQQQQRRRQQQQQQPSGKPPRHSSASRDIYGSKLQEEENLEPVLPATPPAPATVIAATAVAGKAAICEVGVAAVQQQLSGSATPTSPTYSIKGGAKAAAEIASLPRLTPSAPLLVGNESSQSQGGGGGGGGSSKRSALAEEIPLSPINATPCLSRSLAVQRGWAVGDEDTLKSLFRAFYAAVSGSQRARRVAARIFCLSGYQLSAMATDDARVLCEAAGGSMEWDLDGTQPQLVSQPVRRETREQKRELIKQMKVGSC